MEAIGAWDMDTVTDAFINFNDILVYMNSVLAAQDFFKYVQVISCNIIIDNSTQCREIRSQGAGQIIISRSNDRFNFYTIPGGIFDNVNFDDPAMNRGHFIYLYFI